MITDIKLNTTKESACFCKRFLRCNFNLVNHRASQVETLFDVLEDIDPKLRALGVVETHGIVTYLAGAKDG